MSSGPARGGGKVRFEPKVFDAARCQMSALQMNPFLPSLQYLSRVFGASFLSTLRDLRQTTSHPSRITFDPEPRVCRHTRKFNQPTKQDQVPNVISVRFPVGHRISNSVSRFSHVIGPRFQQRALD